MDKNDDRKELRKLIQKIESEHFCAQNESRYEDRFHPIIVCTDEPDVVDFVKESVRLEDAISKGTLSEEVQYVINEFCELPRTHSDDANWQIDIVNYLDDIDKLKAIFPILKKFDKNFLHTQYIEDYLTLEKDVRKFMDLYIKSPEFLTVDGVVVQKGMKIYKTTEKKKQNRGKIEVSEFTISEVHYGGSFTVFGTKVYTGFQANDVYANRDNIFLLKRKGLEEKKIKLEEELKDVNILMEELNKEENRIKQGD